MLRRTIGWLLATTVALSPVAFGQTLSAPDGTVAVGPTGGTLIIRLDSNVEVGAFSYGLCAGTPGVLSIAGSSDVTPAADLAVADFGFPPEFFLAEIFTNGEHTVSCIVDFGGFYSLPAGNDIEVVALHFTGSAIGATTQLCFCNTLGTPPLETLLYSAFMPLVPMQVCGTVELVEPCFPVELLDCAYEPAAGGVAISWTDGLPFTQHEIRRDDVLVGVVAGTATEFVHTTTTGGVYTVHSTCSSGDVVVSAGCTVSIATTGDTNGDGTINVADAVLLLAFLFASGPAPALVNCP